MFFNDCLPIDREDNIETTAITEAGESTDVSFFIAERETIATGFALITALELESAVAEYETEISDAYEAPVFTNRQLFGLFYISNSISP